MTSNTSEGVTTISSIVWTAWMPEQRRALLRFLRVADPDKTMIPRSNIKRVEIVVQSHS